MNFNHVHHLHQQMFYNCHTNSQEHDSCWTFTRPCIDANGLVIRDVEVQLENKQMWQQFHAETTEMIITKHGRRMFPTIQIRINGLDRRTNYCVLMEIIPVSKHRHKYIGGDELVQHQNSDSSDKRYIGWTTAGAAEPQPQSSIDRRIYHHPDSPTSGANWMQHPINFTKLKLTNNGSDHQNNVVLTSMHKYIPRIWIIRAPDIINTTTNLFTESSVSFTFAETVFIAVTAYQNENITKLKINNNPFAKGFRNTGHSRCRRKFHTSICSRTQYNEDGGNVPSSNSESHGKNAKRNAGGYITLNSDDSGVSSFGQMFTPLSIQLPLTIQKIHNHHNDRPSLYRPWADSPSPSSLAVCNIITRLHLPRGSMFGSIVPAKNYATMNFNNSPILFQSMEHETLDVSQRIPRYQYHLPLMYHTTKIRL